MSLEDQISDVTSQNNTGDDWNKIIQICETMDRSENYAREGVTILTKRISHRNVNVVLFSLTLVNSLVQNCNLNVKREICSRRFLDGLVKQLKNPSIHSVVRSRIMELIHSWAEAFSSEPGLDYMVQVYNNLKAQGFDFGAIQAVKSPLPKRTDQAERDKEEEELQLALALSLSAQESEKSRSQNSQPKTGQRARTIEALFNVRALYDFHATEEGELRLSRGDVIQVYDCTTFQDWWKGSLHGQIGIFPSNYVQKVDEVSSEPEAPFSPKNMESHRSMVTKFSENVSRIDPYSNDYMAAERIRKEYQEILDLRPLVIQAAETSRKKQEELTAVHDRFAKAMSNYTKTMEAYSLRQRQAPVTYAPYVTPHQPIQYGQQQYVSQLPSVQYGQQLYVPPQSYPSNQAQPYGYQPPQGPPQPQGPPSQQYPYPQPPAGQYPPNYGGYQ